MSENAGSNATATAARGWGSVRTRSGAYYVRFTAEGKQYERGPFTSWAAADKMRRRAQVMLEGGSSLREVLAAAFGDLSGSTLTFRKATEHYLEFAASRKRDTSLDDDRFRLAMLARAPWAGKVLAAIQPADVLPWITARQTARTIRRLRPRRKGESRRAFAALPAAERFVEKRVHGVAQTTVIKDLVLASSVFEWAIASGYVAANPIRRLKRAAKLSDRGRPERVHLSAPEAVALVAAMPTAIRSFVLAALHTGARRGELLALRWRAVDLARGELTIEAQTAKSGRGRTVPLTPVLRAELESMKDARKVKAIDGSDLAFVTPDGSRLTKALLREAWRPAVDACEAIPKAKRDALTLHGTRHTAASLMVAAGIPILDVARILGHSTVATTMRYARFAPASGRSAINALGAALSASPATAGKTDAATA